MSVPARLPRYPTFQNPDFLATVYDPAGLVVIAADLPVIQLDDVDVRIHREDGGVPFVSADFTGYVPLTQGITSASQVLLRSLRLDEAHPYEVAEVDDDQRRWIMVISLLRRYQPIGVR